MAKAVSNNLLWSENDSLRERVRETQTHPLRWELFVFCVGAEVKWMSGEGERQGDKWVKRDTGAEEVMEKKSQKATESESDC